MWSGLALKFSLQFRTFLKTILHRPANYRPTLSPMFHPGRMFALCTGTAHVCEAQVEVHKYKTLIYLL